MTNDIQKSIEIIIKVQGERYVLTIDEAREIYLILKEMFNEEDK
jgi:hypothetical protein